MNIVLSYVRLQKSTSQILLFCFLCATNIPEQIILDFYEAGADDHFIFDPLITSTFTEKKLDIFILVTIIQPQSMKTAT